MNLYEYVYETLKIYEKNLKQDQLIFSKIAKCWEGVSISKELEKIIDYSRKWILQLIVAKNTFEIVVTKPENCSFF